MNKYLYNGTLLPEIPVIEGYPYITLMLFGKESPMPVVWYTTDVMKVKHALTNGNEILSPMNTEEGTYRIYYLDESTSNEFIEVNYEEDALITYSLILTVNGQQMSKLQWASYNIDMEYIDSEEVVTNTVLYLTGSKPILFIESSTRIIKTSDALYKDIAKICRERLGVETKWLPSELPEAIKSLSSLNDKLFDEKLITNGILCKNEEIEIIGNTMPPACYIGMSFPNLTSISNKYSKISNYAFFGATLGNKKTNFIFEEGISTIGKSAFSNTTIQCNQLILPQTLKIIDDEAFEGVNIVNENYDYNNVLIIPSGVQTIGSNAFATNHDWKEIIIPNSVTSMGRGVFYNQWYTKKVDFSATIDTLPYSCFAGQNELVTLILRRNDKIYKCPNNSYSNIFFTEYDPIPKGTGYIYVPKALLETYKTDAGWSGIASQFRAIEDYPDICGTTE